MIALALALAVAFGALLAACWKLADLSMEIKDDEAAEHAKCIAHVASTVSSHVVAQAIRQAAKDYDSVEGQFMMSKARGQFTPNGPSVPAIWMEMLADQIDPLKEPDA